MCKHQNSLPNLIFLDMLPETQRLFCLAFPGKSKEAEIKRINKELANIRSKFKGKCL